MYFVALHIFLKNITILAIQYKQWNL